MVSEEQLQKIRNKHKSKLDIWRYINSVSPLRKKLSWKIMGIVRIIWEDRGLPRYGQIIESDGVHLKWVFMIITPKMTNTIIGVE